VRSAVRFQMPLRLGSSILSAVANFASTCISMFKKLFCVNLYSFKKLFKKKSLVLRKKKKKKLKESLPENLLCHMSTSS